MGSADDTYFGIVDRDALEQVTRADPATMPPLYRARIERALDIAVWMDLYRPQIVF